MSNPPCIHKILQVEETPGTEAPWAELVTAGLPRKSFKNLAAMLKLSEDEVAQALAVEPPVKGAVLSIEASDAVHRAASALVAVYRQTGWMAPVCSRWLQSPNAALKGRVPLELLKTGMGCEYVATVISRL
jgi:hypothetical protein